MSGINFGDFVRSQYTPIPLPEHDFTGQTIIVTGAGRGLGREAALHFVRLHAETVILAVRDINQGRECEAFIEKSCPSSKGVVETWELDLTKPTLIKQFIAKSKDLPRLDAVVLNAGMSTFSFETVDGVEKTLATNVLGTFLLAIGLLPALREAALAWSIRPRLVLVASEAHAEAIFPERTASDIFGALNDASKSDMTDRYNTTKMLQLLAFHGLRDAVDASPPNAIIFTAVDPGLCHTGLTRELPLFFRAIHRVMRTLLARTAEVGSRCFVQGAADNGADHHGAYLKDGVLGRYVSKSPGQNNAKTTPTNGKYKTTDIAWKTFRCGDEPHGSGAAGTGIRPAGLGAIFPGSGDGVERTAGGARGGGNPRLLKRLALG
ncbi:hypothetical protein AUP68_10281 [Ilyonectria robusta]